MGKGQAGLRSLKARMGGESGQACARAVRGRSECHVPTAIAGGAFGTTDQPRVTSRRRARRRAADATRVKPT